MVLFRARTAYLVVALLTAPLARADGSAEVVIRVGERSMTAGEVEKRMRAMAPFQLRELGSGAAEVKRTYVDRVVAPELLYAEEAEKRELAKEDAVANRIREVLRQAVENELREGLSGESAVTPLEVKRYYDENQHRFNTPPRLRLWRILVADEASAKALLAEVKKVKVEPTVIWTQLARERSLDKATHMRDGNLGFVHPDGKTETPEVRVDPALFQAADTVKDGELVPTPVKEGERWAVVWRRGSMPEVKRTLQQEERTIRQLLMRTKLQEATRTLLDKLEREHVTRKNADLLSFVDIDPTGDLVERTRPGVIPRHKPAKSTAPRRGERGLR